jgi:hypothetical protein
MKRVLVTSCDACFVEGAVALLGSAERCHPDIHRICFVPPDEYKLKLVKLGTLAEVRPFPFHVRAVPEERQVNVGRIFTVTVEADVIAYIDADVVFCRPAPELWEVPRGMVNAVLDDSIVISNNLAGKNLERYLGQFPIVAKKKGVNTGVFALHPDEWKNLPQQFEEALLAGEYQYESIIDQPILNGLMGGKINPLPVEFNAHGLFDNRVPPGVRLVHFTGKTKPWMAEFPKHEPAYWYWLKYGTPQAGRSRLLLAFLWIFVHYPKRLLGKQFRVVSEAYKNRMLLR